MFAYNPPNKKDGAQAKRFSFGTISHQDLNFVLTKDIFVCV